MSVLSDKSIRRLAVEESMISPFIDKQVRDGKISYGLSSFGYDARVGDEFKIFHNVNSSIVDPKEFSSDNFVTKKSSEYIIIPPNSFALGTTIEVFKIPRDIMCIVVGKSTYAYVLLPTTIHIISLGILKTSIVVPRAKELGGIIIYSELFLVTKLSELNSLGSTIEELTLWNILNSSPTLAS